MGAVVGTIGIVVRTSEMLDTALLDTALLAMESSPRLVLQDQPVDRVPTRKLRCGCGRQSEAIRADRSLLNS